MIFLSAVRPHIVKEKMVQMNEQHSNDLHVLLTLIL